MSFTHKNLQAKKSNMGFMKWATLFFLWMSAVLFVARAFDIGVIMPNAVQYIQKVFLTSDGSNSWTTGITLDGTTNGGITITNLPSKPVLGTDANGKLIASTSGDVYNYIHGLLSWSQWATWAQWLQWPQGNTWATWAQGIPWVWSWTAWATWPAGPQGNTWVQWLAWATWPAGPQGDTGAMGETWLLKQWVLWDTPYYDWHGWITMDSNIFNTGWNVGIGTTGPLGKLSVYNGGTIDLFPNAHNAFIDISSESISDPSHVTPQGLRIGNGSLGWFVWWLLWNYNGMLVLSARVWSTPSADLVVSTGWNIGIGTTNPVAPLHVIGRGKFTNSVQVGSPETNRCSTPADKGKIVYTSICYNTSSSVSVFLWCMGSWASWVIGKVLMTWNDLISNLNCLNVNPNDGLGNVQLSI